ncbi:hypothetical protein OG458_41635 (plasmid) [Streptomyces sp. NBC_01281]|uniref:hypothetical protein n=1 Tax=Streptomyces sp. NBC_01281 TaxID=2903811 RepID=UPI002E13585E|nr:hypothetical protein OG458_41635 [Streptomyces sp. NBC_01281]
MPGDESNLDRNDGAAQPRSTIQRAIDWFATDRSPTRQTIPHHDGPITPDQLLGQARFDIQVNSMLSGQATTQAQQLVRAQADWLIQHMPSDHNPPSLDSAQQAGRAWGILITTGSGTQPEQDVLTEVAAQTGISPRVAQEIREQARSTDAAYNRADRLAPYDDAADELLIGDWNTLVACGPDLPEASERAREVLDLLTARMSSAEEHAWMGPAAQQAAQIHASVIRAQPLLASIATTIPRSNQSGVAEGLERLIDLDKQGHLTAAATAAARARAVQEWAEPGAAAAGTTTPGADRTRILDAAAPAVRTLRHLNTTLAALHPLLGQSHLSAFDPQGIERIVVAIGELSARVTSTLRPKNSRATTRHPEPTHRHHQQQLPEPGPSSGGPSPRATP